jgi:cellulose synthase/poly-beta-1,6-N-acetylglucosamine synthase-like glycosyltransferase
MREIVIKSHTIKREFFILLSCFLFAFLLNAFAINKFGTSWSELFTQIGYVVVITAVVYVLLALFRLVIWLIMRLFRRKR